MRAFVFRGLATATILGMLVASLSCAHDQQLVSIEIQPGSFTVGDSNTPIPNDAGGSTQLRALGTYIHPPVTKDITNEVTWGSDDQQIFTVGPTGLLAATGLACGSALISATVQTNSSAGNRTSSGAIVTSNMLANVVCPSPTAGQLNLTIGFSGVGSGTVTSTPPELGCSSTCTGSFAIGSPVTLTASPAGSSTFGGWVGCDSTAGNSCSVTMTTNRTVTVTFN